MLPVTVIKVGWQGQAGPMGPSGPVDESTSMALQAHVTDGANPHGVTKAQLGLGNVDNTSDAGKPLSMATSAALQLKMDKSGGAFTDEVEFNASVTFQESEQHFGSEQHEGGVQYFGPGVHFHATSYHNGGAYFHSFEEHDGSETHMGEEWHYGHENHSGVEQHEGECSFSDLASSSYRTREERFVAVNESRLLVPGDEGKILVVAGSEEVELTVHDGLNGAFGCDVINATSGAGRVRIIPGAMTLNGASVGLSVERNARACLQRNAVNGSWNLSGHQGASPHEEWFFAKGMTYQEEMPYNGNQPVYARPFAGNGGWFGPESYLIEERNLSRFVLNVSGGENSYAGICTSVGISDFGGYLLEQGIGFSFPGILGNWVCLIGRSRGNLDPQEQGYVGYVYAPSISPNWLLSTGYHAFDPMGVGSNNVDTGILVEGNRLYGVVVDPRLTYDRYPVKLFDLQTREILHSAVLTQSSLGSASTRLAAHIYNLSAGVGGKVVIHRHYSRVP